MTKEEYNNNRPTITCPLCGREITNACYKRHYEACSNPNSKMNLKSELDLTYRLDHDDLFCKFCGKEYKSKNALCQHELRCKLNPNRKNYDSFSNYIRQHRKGTTKYNNSEVAKAVKTLTEHYSKGLIKHSNTGWGYGFKSGWYKNIWCDSSWELAFVVYCIDNSIPIVRNKVGFQWKDANDSYHTYYPDFIIDGIYYEIKGRVDDTTIRKAESVLDNGCLIIIIDSYYIDFYLEYCENKYGKDYWNLYDSK